MSTQSPPLASLRVFEAAARHLSFKQAAGELHVTPAAVSHQIKALEEILGIALFIRLTRALELTEAGRAMLPRVQEGLACFEQAVDLSRRVSERTRLDVFAPPSFATRWLIHRMQAFNEDHPDIEIRLSTALNTVDSTDNQTREADLAPLIEGEADIQVRFGHGIYPGMRSEFLFPVSYAAICHPRLLVGEQPLREPADLRFHTLIHDDTYRDDAELANWPAWLHALGIEGIDASRGPRFSNSGLAIDAAMDGMGIAISVSQLLDRDVAAGRLARLFDLKVESSTAYYVVAADNMARRPHIEAFRNWLLREARSVRRS